MAPIRVLVVEDEQIVAEDLRLLLHSIGYTVTGTAASGEEAVRLAREMTPDVIMMDISLGGSMDGTEAAAKIAEFHDAPVIYLTAFADAAIIERAKVTRPYGYIIKPYQEREIRTAIEIALYTHSLHRKIAESEERYRGFVQNFLGIAYRRRADASPEFFQGAVESISGYTEPELLAGTPAWEDLVHQDDAGRIRAQDREIAAMKSGEVTRDYRIIRKDGTVIWVHELIRVTPGMAGKPRSVQGAIYDITGRKMAEEALQKMNRELEERVNERTLSLHQQVQFLQQLIDTIPSPVYYKDPRCAYLGCNTAFESYLGIPRAKILGRTDADLLPPDIAALTREKDLFLLDHRGIQSYQVKFPHADRTTREVLVKKATYHDTRGKIAGFIGVFLDITDRIRAEEQVRESEQRFRAVVQDQTDMIFRYLPNRTVLFANDAFLAYFGKRSEDVTGYIFRLPVHPDDQAGVEAHFASLSPTHPVGTTEFRSLHEGGQVRWQQWINRAFFDERGNVSEYLSVGRDITDKKENERREREAYQQIERNMQQFSSLNDQIRNPLSVIVMLAGSEEGDHAQKILAQAREINSILDRLDTGWRESEKVRVFLKKHYGIGGEGEGLPDSAPRS
ncbi:MAG: aerobic respiration control sensor protein ArcB [Methanoregulaceae archaeon PtaU1.Bin059]|nr:MAG: aerobic respiration control sensor protein ArcB [Methanoregulaceae archaeon PtaB.Bin152]OPY36647.1 MAG: aerobic respiration control sensor protein ArcB [Methanoregulaceae archaeon PtaU1.Bin059]